MGTIIGIGGTPNNNTQGGGDSPSTELIDVNSAGLSFGGTDFTKSNILEKYDFSNVAYPCQFNKHQIGMSGITEDADNYFEAYAGTRSSNDVGMFQNCVFKFTDINKLFAQLDYTRLKDIRGLFTGSIIIVDDSPTINNLKRGIPLFFSFSNYINNGPQRLVGRTFEDCMIAIIDPSSTIESIFLVGDLAPTDDAIRSNETMLIGNPSIIRMPSYNMEGAASAFDVSIKYKNITLQSGFNFSLSSSSPISPVVELGNIKCPHYSQVQMLITSTVTKIGNITTELVSDYESPFYGWDSVVEVGKFPKIVYNSLHMENIENFSSETLEKLFNDTANQGLQAPEGGGTLYVSQTINDRMTQAQRDNLTSLGYTISVS